MEMTLLYDVKLDGTQEVRPVILSQALKDGGYWLALEPEAATNDPEPVSTARPRRGSGN